MTAEVAPYVLRFEFSAVFGKRGPLVQSFSRWLHECAGPVLNLDLRRCVFALGFIGTSHSTASLDCTFDSLEHAAGFLAAFGQHGIPAWTNSPEREWVVDGSRRWELWRMTKGVPAHGDTGLVVQWSMKSMPGRVSELVEHVEPAIGNVLAGIGLGEARRRALVGVVGAPEDAVTVEMDLTDMDELSALLGHMESPAAGALIASIAHRGFVVPGSQNWIVLRKLSA